MLLFNHCCWWAGTGCARLHTDWCRHHFWKFRQVFVCSGKSLCLSWIPFGVSRPPLSAAELVYLCREILFNALHAFLYFLRIPTSILRGANATPLSLPPLPEPGSVLIWGAYCHTPSPLPTLLSSCNAPEFTGVNYLKNCRPTLAQISAAGGKSISYRVHTFSWPLLSLVAESSACCPIRKSPLTTPYHSLIYYPPVIGSYWFRDNVLLCFKYCFSSRWSAD